MGIVFSTIDVRTGPIPLYSNLDKSLAKKIAIKSMISTMSFSHESNDNSKVEGEAIIPFPDENLVCFIYYTTIDQIAETGDKRLISLALATETRKVGTLYKSAPKISTEAKRIAKLINATYEYPNPIPEVLKQELNNWGTLTKDIKVKEVSAKTQDVLRPSEFNFQDLFELFKDKKFDPMAKIFISFFWSIPVCFVGNDPSFLIEIANMFNEMFKPKDLRIELPTASEIPRSDIICLTTEQYKEAKFFDDPLLISSISSDIIEMNFEIDKASLGVVEEWLKKSRRRVKSDVDFAKRTIHDESKKLIGKLEVLVQMANSKRTQNLGIIMTKLKSNKAEMDFILYIILNYPKYCPIELLNQLLKPKTPYEAFKVHDKTKIGYIMQ